MKRVLAITCCLWGLFVTPLNAAEWKAALAEMPKSAMQDDAGNMTAVVRTMSDEDLEAMAAYLATLR